MVNAVPQRKIPLPLFSSKRGRVTDKHALIGVNGGMFGCQTFEV